MAKAGYVSATETDWALPEVAESALVGWFAEMPAWMAGA